MTRLLGGIDIGGTKCAVALGELHGAEIRIVGKRAFATGAPDETIANCLGHLDALAAEQANGAPAAIGISCGGPLDSRLGLILSPPNLPGWERFDVVTPVQERFHAPVALQNDANAGALAEWKWGAGKGCTDFIFLTFGTGMGAGLILNGRLYSGANGMAGEVGHVRLEHDGPIGYGKAGSFEGFCSGGGIALMARAVVEQRLAEGKPGPSFCPTPADLPAVTAEKVGIAAQQGDPIALDIYTTVGRQLGRGLAILVDILNPQKIVMGSIYVRQQAVLRDAMLETLQQEALPKSLAACEIVPAKLAENVGDYASLSVAYGLIAD